MENEPAAPVAEETVSAPKAASRRPEFDLSAYLNRIGLNAAPDVTPAGLAQVQRAHRLAIPFENLDIPLGCGIALDRAAVFEKLVHRRRGGYCFEQNGLFEDALRALGFSVRPLLARVLLGMETGVVAPLTHQLELVTFAGEDWIADAGFGGSFCPPMPLAEGQSGPGPDGTVHRLRRADGSAWLLERLGPARIRMDAAGLLRNGSANIFLR